MNPNAKTPTPRISPFFFGRAPINVGRRNNHKTSDAGGNLPVKLII